MKIAVVSTDAMQTPPTGRRYGGLEQVVYALACDLVALGHEVTLFALQGSVPGPYDLVTFGSVHELREEGAARERLLGADVVHCHDWYGLGWELARAHPGRSFVHTWHGPSLGPLAEYRRPPRNLALCGVSHWHAWSLACELGCEVHGVPNGVPLDEYPIWDGPRDGYLLSVNRLDPAKGIDRAIELALHLGVQLRIAGPEWGVPSEAYVRAILGRCDGRTIVYEGNLGLERKRYLMQRAAALLWLPAAWEEPFGLAMVEANACGTPVVALDRGAVSEVLGFRDDPYATRMEQWTGGVIAGRPQDLPRAVELARWMRERSQHDIRANAERYSVRAMTEHYLEVYRQCMSSSPAAPASEAPASPDGSSKETSTVPTV